MVLGLQMRQSEREPLQVRFDRDARRAALAHWAVAARARPSSISTDGVKLPGHRGTPIAALVGSPARLAFTLRRRRHKPESVSLVHRNDQGPEGTRENAKFSVAVGDERHPLATMDKAVEFETPVAAGRVSGDSRDCANTGCGFLVLGRKKMGLDSG